MKPKILHLLLPITCLFLFSCSSDSNSHSNYSEEHVLRLNMGTDPPTLDSRQATDLSSSIVLKMLFEGLTRIGLDNQPHPAAADKIDISKDQLTYTFHIRPARWSNGDPVTAHDFEYSWKMVMDPKFPSQFAYIYYMIKNGKEVKSGQLPLSELGVKAVDDQTLVVQLEHPVPYFLTEIALHFFYPVPQKVVENDPKWSQRTDHTYISNGPFLLKTWKHNNEMVLEKNPTYWDATQVKLDEIRFFMVEDPNTEFALFEQGNIDFAGKPISSSLPLDAIPELKKEGRLNTRPMNAIYMYIFNTSQIPFNNVNIRKAFALAINRKQIVDNITQGDEPVATQYLPTSQQIHPKSYFSDGDVEEARKHLKKGLAELNLTLETLPPIHLQFNTQEGHNKIAQAVQQQWLEALDIKVILENQDWKVYLDNLRGGNFQIARLSWVSMVKDPIGFLEIFKYPDMNSTRWSSDKFAVLLTESDHTLDTKKRLELLQEAEAILMAEMPFIPMYYLTLTYLKNPKLHDALLSELGDVDFRWAWKEK